MAAGLGFKTFNTGDVLTAADTNGYLMQGVWVFANAAARTSAVTSPQEGNVSFLKDTNSLEIYDGAAWVAYGAGDITGVTAGTGISGGGTAGTVTITNDMATTITASGDIVVGTGNGTYDNLPIGTTGQVLTADTSVSPYKVKWAAAAAGGKVLQVVSSNYNTQVTNSTSTYADTGLTATITPTLNTSKILVLVSQNGLFKSSDSQLNAVNIKLFRGATELLAILYNMYDGDTGRTSIYSGVPMCYLDSPATTSAITYKTQFANDNNGASVRVQYGSTAPSQITLLEIGA